jgi:hypothetical protein
MAPSLTDLEALADKYDALVQLRSRRDSGGPEASRLELRELARRFPGSLRELDTLGPVELRRRAVAARVAAAGGPCEPWMSWIAAFHRLMTAALLVKADPSSRRGQAPSADVQEELARRAELQVGIPLERTLLRTFARPPAGRLAPLVIDELARRFGVGAEEMRSCLFPRRVSRLISASRSS